MSTTARTAAGRLMAAEAGDALAALCEIEGIELLVLFGSAAREESDPADVDLAVRFANGVEGDTLSVLARLYEVTGYENVDLLDLRRAGPLARDRALSGGRLLYQAAPGLFANAQIAAMMERLETAELRRVELDLLGR